MTKPAHQPDPRRQQGQQPGIINDLPAEFPPAGQQSMIINDLYPAPQAPGQQMIINDVPATAGRAGGQQMFVNDPRLTQPAGNPQQMIVNDMAFSDLVKGLEALSKGDVAAGGQMIINDVSAAAPPATRQMPQPQPQARPAPAAQMRQQPGTQQMPVQQHTQQVPVQQRVQQQAPMPQQHVQQQVPAPQQRVQQPSPAPQQRVQQVPAPQQMQPQRQHVQMAQPQAAPQPQAQQPRQELESRQNRQAVQPQPMVINTPQPLVKPRREELLTNPQQHMPAPAQRLPQEPGSRQSTGAPGQIESQTAATRGGRRTPAPAKKSQTRQDNSASKGSKLEEWKGSYSGWTMMPSLVLCIGLSTLAVWFTIRYVPTDFWLEFLGATLGGIWVLQLVRWAYRVVGFRYRLTTDFLHMHRGLLYGKPVQVPRCQIMKVTVSANLLEKILGVGKVVVEVKDNNPATVELEGVLRPKEIVQMIDPKKARAA